MEILGWVSWVIVLACAILLTYGCVTRKPAPTTLIVEAVSFWILVGSFLLMPDWPKLYILWVMPIVFIAVKYLVPVLQGKRGRW